MKYKIALHRSGEGCSVWYRVCRVTARREKRNLGRPSPPSVFAVRSRIVAKVDSMGFVV